MKNLSLLLVVYFLLSFQSPSTSLKQSDEFCEGWHDGYIQGWCYERPNCYEPYVPYCPYPDYDEDNYKGGYNRGFLKGLRARQ